MTREEAIEILNTIKTTEDEFDALNMAIEALEKEQKRGKWVEDEYYPYCVCNKCGQMCGIQNNGWCNYAEKGE